MNPNLSQVLTDFQQKLKKLNLLLISNYDTLNASKYMIFLINSNQSKCLTVPIPDSLVSLIPLNRGQSRDSTDTRNDPTLEANFCLN